MKPVIIYDSREREVAKELGTFEVSLVRETLAPGDFVLSEDHVVERKTGNDFASSILDGRLFEELTRCMEAYKFTTLLIEDWGSWVKVKRQTNLPKASVYGALKYIMDYFWLRVFKTTNIHATAEWLVEEATYIQEKRKTKKPIFSRHLKKMGTWKLKRINWLEGFPLLAGVQAESVYNAFPTMYDFLSAVCETPLRYTPSGYLKWGKGYENPYPKQIGPKMVLKWRQLLGLEATK